ncbi:Uncharacterised protein g1535 [Pycnogonum litorale]
MASENVITPDSDPYADVEEIPAPKKARKRPFRFSARADILLLREALALNPFLCDRGSQYSAWEDVSESVLLLGLHISGRRCRERILLLVQQFRRGDWEMLRRSGTEEQYNEKEKLLQEVVELLKEKEVASLNKKKDHFREQRIALRDAEVQCCSSPVTTNTSVTVEEENVEMPSISHNNKQNSSPVNCIIEYLREKGERDRLRLKEEFRLRDEEINIKKREVEVQERKFKLEEAERFQHLELEKKEKDIYFREREAFLDLLKKFVAK